MIKERSPGKASLLLFGVILIWGGNFSAVKIGLLELNPVLFTALRFLPASIPLLILGRFWGVDFSLKREDIWPILGISILGTTIYQTLFALALDQTTPGNSSLLMATSPIFAALITSRLGQDRITPQGVIGILTAFLGAYLVITGQHRIQLEEGTRKGDLLFFSVAALWAVSSFFIRNLLQKHHFLKLIFYTSALGGLLLLLPLLPQIIRLPFGDLRPGTWIALGYSTFLATSLGLTAWYYGLEQVGTTRTIVYMYLTPVMAGIFSVLFYGEEFTLQKILGAVIILTGVHLARKGTIPIPRKGEPLEKPTP